MSVAYATRPLAGQITIARVMLGLTIALLGSFNHLPLTQVHFLLGSAPYYFLVVLGIFLLAGNCLIVSRQLFVALLLVLAVCTLSICVNLPMDSRQYVFPWQAVRSWISCFSAGWSSYPSCCFSRITCSKYLLFRGTARQKAFSELLRRSCIIRVPKVLLHGSGA